MSKRESTRLKSGHLFAAGLSITWNWLQIDTDMLLIITSTGDELLRNVNIDDHKNGYQWFLVIFACKKINCDEIDGETKITREQELSYSLARIVSISSDFFLFIGKQKDYPSCNKSGSNADFEDKNENYLEKLQKYWKVIRK